MTETLLLIYIAECTFGGSGRWLEIGPLSIRMILFALCFLATLPAVFQKIKKLTVNFQVIITVLFGIHLGVCAVIGFTTGNKLSFIISDITTFMALALIPGFLAVMCNKRAIERSISVVFVVATALSIVGIILHLVDAFVKESVMMDINDWLNERSLGGMALMQTGIHRIYMKSQMFIQVSIIYGIWMLGKKDCQRKKTIAVAEGILFCGCILTYTRGFWLGLAASAGLLLLMGFKYWGGFLKVAGKMLAVFAAFVLISTVCYRGLYVPIEIVNRFDPNLLVSNDFAGNSLDSKNDKNSSDKDKNKDKFKNEDIEENNIAARDLRAKTLKMLKKRIANHPIIGNGLGENLDSIRDDGKTEYMYLDTTMKTGIIGTSLFVLTYFGFIAVQIYYSLKRRKLKLPAPEWEDAEIRNRFITAAYLGIAVTSFFNPFMNNPMGIVLLTLTATAVYEGKPKNSEV